MTALDRLLAECETWDCDCACDGPCRRCQLLPRLARIVRKLREGISEETEYVEELLPAFTMTCLADEKQCDRVRAAMQELRNRLAEAEKIAGET